MAELELSSLILALMVLLLVHCSDQLETSQYDALMRIKQQLNFPAELSSWSDNADFCNSVPNPFLTLVCYEDNMTQLHVSGNSFFPQYSQDFSISSFFSNLAAFPNLKVLSLVSLGLRGSLPPIIGALSSLEILNVSSNFIYGNIPGEISQLKSLQTLILDHNMFTGELPVWLGTLPVLSVLSLNNNSISGSLPTSLSGMESLRALLASSNFLSGDVPNLQNLTNLQVLDLENNKLGPHLPGVPSKLVSLALRNNSFSVFELDKLKSCYQLEKLDVSMNEFVGPFSPALLSLPSLTYINVAGNRLSGRLSKNMTCNAVVTFVNLSSNRLTGELPSCLLSKDRNVNILYAGNCLSKRYPEQAPESYCHNEALAVKVIPPHKHEKKAEGKAVIASCMMGGIIGAIALLGLAFVIVKREYIKKQEDKVPHTRLIVEKVSPALTLKLLKDASYISETRKLEKLGLPPYRTFVLDELKEATSNFGVSNLISEGTHGQVYKGWLSDGTVVAIRSLKMRKKHGVQSYTRQLEQIAKLRHCNLVSAFGHCFEFCKDDSNVNKVHLILEYVPNGTLRSFISEAQTGQKFSWTQRLAAVIGIAKGIQFLHTGTVPGIFSNELKITDVLLDHDYHVKISKYNLPLLDEDKIMVNNGFSSSGPKQSSAPRKTYEEKNDVYDFGVILLEVIVGRAIISQSDIDTSKHILLSCLASDGAGRRAVVDPAVRTECSNASLKTVMDLCGKCLSEVPFEWPSVEDVIWNLQFAAQLQDSCMRDSYSNQGSPVHLS